MKKFAWILLAVLLLCACAEETPTVSRDPDALYWNVDRGVAREQEDGLWQVRLLCDGKEEIFAVADAAIISRLDSLDVLGLRFDDAGRISAVLSLDDMPYRKAGWNYYVRRQDGAALTLNSSLIMAGEELVLPLSGAEICYDMTGDTQPAGTVAALKEGDRVCCVLNTQGTLHRVYIVKHGSEKTEYQMYGGRNP